MKYDFDILTERRGTDSVKWNVGPGELPMWIADMDFQTSPAITQALEAVAKRGIFGYTEIPERWYDAYISWWKTRHGYEISRSDLVFCTGVIPAISSAVRKFTSPAEKVIVMTPVYNIFFNSIYNNGRFIEECPLSYKNGSYSVDFDLLCKKASDPQASMLILCNPHNPVGKIWDVDTLRKIGEICAANNVTVFSDEIHCDLTDPGCEYTPFAKASGTCRNISITAVAPTKAFSIPGLQTAAVFASNPVLRHKIWRGLNTDEVAEPNSFAVEASVAAFTKGGEWLDQAREYIFQNKCLVREYVEKNIPSLKLIPSQATYLLWFDCSAYTADSEELCRFIRNTTGLYLNDGAEYRGNGKTFFRMNIACPRQRLTDGLERLKKALSESLKR
ncbi:MAG: pyridoxal phosphate-dependent aminotransferase [Treponema sp.]|nr:pyridoxal phosphate-dependent aminotransferase [Treponema sp.]